MDLTSLFKPDPGLGKHIFDALLALAISAVVAAVVARVSRKAGQVPSACRSLHEVDDALSTAWDTYSEAMPGVLIVVGLVGTFVGLSVAITQAGEAIRTQPVNLMDFGVGSVRPVSNLDKLLPVLAGMGVKFKSSIWGISFSLVTRALNYAISRGPRKKDALRILNNRKTELSQFSEDLWNELEGQKEAIKAIGQQLAAHHTALGELLTVNGKAFGHLEKMYSLQEKYADARAADAVDLKKSLSDQNDIMNRTSNALSSMNTCLASMLQKQQDAVGELKTLNSVTVQQNTTLGSVLTEQKSAVGELKTLNSVTAQQNTTLGGMLAEQKNAVNMLGGLSKTSEALKEGSKDISKSAGSMSTAANDLKNSLESMRVLSEGMAKENNKQLEKSRDALTKSATKLDESIKNAMASFGDVVKQALGDMAGNMDKVTSSIQKSVNDSSSAISNGIGGLSGSLGQLETGLLKAIGEVETTISHLNAHMINLGAQITDMRHSAAQQKDSSKTMLERVENMASETAKIGRLVANAERLKVADAVEKNGVILSEMKNLLEAKSMQEAEVAGSLLTKIDGCLFQAQESAKTQSEQIIESLAERSQQIERLLEDLLTLQRDHLGARPYDDVLFKLKDLVEVQSKQYQEIAGSQLTTMTKCLSQEQDSAKIQSEQINSGFGSLLERSQQIERLLVDLITLQRKHLEVQPHETVWQEQQLAAIKEFCDIGGKLHACLLPLPKLLEKFENNPVGTSATRGSDEQDTTSAIPSGDAETVKPILPANTIKTNG